MLFQTRDLLVGQRTPYDATLAKHGIIGPIFASAARHSFLAVDISCRMFELRGTSLYCEPRLNVSRGDGPAMKSTDLVAKLVIVLKPIYTSPSTFT